MFTRRRLLIILLGALICLVSSKNQSVKKLEPYMPAPYTVSEASVTEDITATLESLDEGYRLSYENRYFEYNTLGEAIGSAPEFSRVNFLGVSGSESISITKSLTLTGELSLSGSLYVTSPELNLCDLSLSFCDGALYIKGGAVTMTGGEITSDTHSVVLDYSVMDSFTMYSGEIYSSATGILLNKGRASILGGEIHAREYAIKSMSTLILGAPTTLSGDIYDLYITEPIIAEEAGCEASGLSVLADMDIGRGRSTPIVLNAQNTKHDGLKIYTPSADEYTPCFTSECYGVNEKNFISVHLPYTLSLYDEDRLIARYEYLKGEPTAPPIDPVRAGYSFLGWCLDAMGNCPYTFSQPLTSDVNVFAQFALLPPTYEIQPIFLTYDGLLHFVRVEGLAHPLSAEGSFSFEWYKNGESLNLPSDGVPVREVADSGEYKCKITFLYKGDFVSVVTPAVSVVIEKMKVALPGNIKVEYNGAYQSPPPPVSELYTQETLSFINAGVYTVGVSLTDKDNCIFEGASSCNASFVFEIIRAKNLFISPQEVGPAFLGLPPTVTSRAAFGTAYTEYLVRGEWTRNYPNALGEYMLRSVVAPSQNFEGVISPPVAFEIKEDICIGLSIDTPPSQTEYLAFETLSLDGAEIYAVYTSGIRKALHNNELTVKYKSGDSLRVFDSSVTLIFGEVSLPLSVSVRPREYDISGVRLEKAELIYSQGQQRPSVICEVVGIDGIPLTYTVRGGGGEVGEYRAYIDFATESFNYTAPPTLELGFRILPLEITPVFENTRFTYDKSPKSPSAYIVTPKGQRIELTVIGGATLAGEYRAQALAPSQNYILKDAFCDFVIERARLDLSSAVWSDSVFYYNGTRHSVTLEGLPEGVSVIGYAGHSASEAGEYTATATLYFDERNYISEGFLTHKYTVKPILYDTSGLMLLDTVLTYDGYEKYPEIRGVLPVGLDGSVPTVVFEGAPTDATEGASVKITLVSSSKNYLSQEPIYRTVTVLPKQIEVIWTVAEQVYDGTVRTPYAHSPECELKVTGGGINAGEYIVTATPRGKNYKVINPTLIFKILKMKNSFTDVPSILGGYEGDALHPTAVAKYGEVRFSYYTDITLLTEAPLPLSYGSYYMVASVSEGENYEGIVSAPIPFSVKQVVPISITARLKNTSLFAYELLTDADLEVFFTNNNGSTSEVPYTSVAVTYQNGNSLRARDSLVNITAGGLTCTIPVRVALATYDTSNVRWSVTNAVYNGKCIESHLTGLPDGVSVCRYISNSGTDAGKYPLLATLNYDKENYNPPHINEAYLTVERRLVSLPDDLVFTYDGEAKKLDLPECEYYVGGSLVASSVGRYLLSVNLYDTKNYKTDKEGVTLIIHPRNITLEVTDKRGSYKCVSGNIIKDDELGIAVTEKDGFVYISVQNPNYFATVIPFDKSKDGDNIWILLLIILIAMILSALLYILYIRRDLLVLGLRSIRERLKGKSRYITYQNQGVPTATALLATDAKYADRAITNYLARSLVRKGKERIYTEGKGRATVCLADISEVFSSSDRIDINSLKEKGLVPMDCSYVRIEGGGVIDKALHIIADSFSPVAVKMIALTSGTATRSHTRVKRKK